VIRENHRSFIECGSMREEILPPWLAAIRARHRHSVSAMPNTAVTGRGEQREPRAGGLRSATAGDHGRVER
jgi:hypothetical protein